MLLFYVRHGDPIYNPDSLTELGRSQADALVKRMRRIAPDRIFASSSTRAIQTAQPTADALGKEITVMDWCNEGHAWHDFTVVYEDGKRRWPFYDCEMRKLFCTEEMRRFGKEWYRHPKVAETRIPEGVARVAKGTDEFLLSLGYRHVENGYIAENPNDERIAWFAHQATGLAVMSHLLDIPYPELCMRFDMGHTGVTAIDFAGDGFVVPRVMQWSNDSHLFADDGEPCYQNKLEF